jgi:hypothetical protein
VEDGYLYGVQYFGFQIERAAAAPTFCMPMPMSGPSQITRQSERAISFVNPHILDHVLGEGKRMCVFQPKINDHQDTRDM